MKTKKKLRKSRNIKEKSRKTIMQKDTLYKRSYYFTTLTNLTSLFQSQYAFTVYTCIFIIMLQYQTKSIDHIQGNSGQPYVGFDVGTSTDCGCAG